jgi:O-antigen/teichoic acid export membrane protein
LLRTALPLGVVTGLVSLNFSIPRYFLEASHGPAELGVFAAMSYCVIAGGLLVNALGQSAVTRLARLYSSGDGPGFRDLLLRLVACGLGLSVLALAAAHLAGRRVLELLYGPEFAAQPTTFTLVVLGGSIGYVASFLGYGMTAARWFRVQVSLFAALAALNALCCSLLVPPYASRGAALATVITALAGLVGSLAIQARALRALRA